MGEDSIDKALISKAIDGDREAFDVLVLKYQSKISQAMSRFVDDRSIIMDIVQETFVKAYRSLSSFRGDSSFYTWVYRIAINTAKNFSKQKIRRPPDEDIDFLDAENQVWRTRLKETATPERLLLRDELQETVLMAVNTLPDVLRISLILREMGGLSYDEIASVMNCPVGTVRSRIFRARVALESQIKPLINQ